MNKVNGILVDVKNGVVKPYTVTGTGEKQLNAWYEVLNCDYIDIVHITVGGERYTVVCDDEALLKENPIPSAIGEDGVPVLYGNLFICRDKFGRDGVECASITSDDWPNIYKHKMFGLVGDKVINVIAPVIYG